MKKHIYFKNLDGLRFICFLSVFFYHSFYSEFEYIRNSPLYYFIKKDLFGNGNLGVNFFFVLSGFLITLLLIEEKKMNGQVDIKFFYIRRTLRIWPLYFFCVFFGFIIFPWFKSYFEQIPLETANPLAYLTFTSNFDRLKNGLPDASVLAVLWSIGVEEQFYFFWPIIIFIFPVKKLWIPFVTAVISSLVFRAFNDSADVHEYHTLSCLGDIAVGALGAWLISTSNVFKEKIQYMNKLKISSLYILFTLIFLFRDEFLYSTHTIRIFERLFISIIIIFIILEQCYSVHSLFKMSNFKKLTKLGLITYGLYCFHFIGILITTTLTRKFSINTELWQVLIVDTLVSFTLSILISKLSYKFFEKPLLKLKNKFAYITR